MGGLGFPDLEVAAGADEGDLFAEAGVFGQGARQDDAAFLVGFGVGGVGVEGQGQVLLLVAEAGELLDQVALGVEGVGVPALDAGMLVRGAQDQLAVRRVVTLEDVTERRRNGHAALSVPASQMGALELGHPCCVVLVPEFKRAGTGAGARDPGPPAVSPGGGWVSMGFYGKLPLRWGEDWVWPGLREVDSALIQAFGSGCAGYSALVGPVRVNG